MVKTSKLLAVICASITLIIFACKHEIPTKQGDTGNGNGIGGGGGTTTPPPVFCSPDTAYFQQQVLPIFVSNCALSGCHDAASHQDGITLTSYTGIMEEISPGNLRNSKIWRKINEDDRDDIMPPPPRNPLTQQQKDVIAKWILQGAKNNSCQSSSCDSTNVTYSITIRSIVSTKCQGCHSGTAASAGYDFSQYAVLKARVNDGKLWGAINHLAGYSPMPKNGNKLSDCEINQIRKWIDMGAPNN